VTRDLQPTLSIIADQGKNRLNQNGVSTGKVLPSAYIGGTVAIDGRRRLSMLVQDLPGTDLFKADLRKTGAAVRAPTATIRASASWRARV